VMGDDRNPTLSLLAYTGDLGLNDGSAQSVYLLDKSRAKPIRKADGKPFRVDLQTGQGVVLPNRMGSVSFDGVAEWNRVQISRTPGIWATLGGISLALVGLMMSLFIRPRRIWVRARPTPENQAPDNIRGDLPQSSATSSVTMVEVAGLDRSGNGDLPTELAAIVRGMTDAGLTDVIRKAEA